MAVILFLLCLGAGFLGLTTMVAAKSSIHEIFGGVLLLMSAVFLVGSFVVAAISSAAKRIVDALPTPLLTDRKVKAGPAPYSETGDPTA